MTSQPHAPRQAPLPAAPAPRGAGATAVVGPLLAVAVLALALVLAHDALVGLGWLGGSPWLVAGARAVDGQEPTSAVGAIGLVVGLLGLTLLIAGLARRPRRAVRFRSDAGIWMPLADLARFTSAQAREVPGVLHASTVASRRGVRVQVRTTGDTQIAAAVESRLHAALAPLAPLRISVRPQAPVTTSPPRPEPTPTIEGTP
ncbi:conserved hypothetical protein [Beutenbergia cavernae DSM 12333]|uniref:Alkaline shock response membrane anchor protein AmaP n=1 Tax=Beutenbergia cavernae (strain ATCC BAA-8 / DSM 12333 / CCUG 43141 / JCM 11478 / NBRC 16432 / NCIMB 13614 / HKI 0122) TaxID=471853 RepID=C5C280_BEUC1|nr:DUF6286 domain-containing protein [Beutenbergia cavernae]ACQ81705.1 conserved hypothetical protein [Beutenbergia cavernae DSM 12333]